jgi:hypothetical protein
MDRWSIQHEGRTYVASDDVSRMHEDFLRLVTELKSLGASLLQSNYSGPYRDGQGLLEYDSCKCVLITSLPAEASLDDIINFSKSEKGYGIEEEIRLISDRSIHTIYNGSVNGNSYSDLNLAKEALKDAGYF